MLRYFISTCFFLCFFLGLAQGNPTDSQTKDSVVYKQKYGIRVGVDLSRPITSFFNDEYTGLEFVGDYRLTQNLYLAGELGNEKKTRQERIKNNIGNIAPLYNFTTSGSYIKVGVDYNTYGNWYGEQNMIFIGGRLAFSSFSQTLNDYNIFDSNRYWNPNGFAQGALGEQEFKGLTATWLEFVFGFKVELFANIYMGGSVRLGFLLDPLNKQPQEEEGGFRNLWIPGFNKVTDGSNFGVGYNYTISYFLPLYKKAKKPKKEAGQIEE